MFAHSQTRKLVLNRRHLSIDERGLLDRHLEGCSECREYADDVARQDVLLRAMPLPEPGTSMSAAVLAQIDGRSASVLRWLRVPRLRAPTVVASVLVGVAAILIASAVVLAYGQATRTNTGQRPSPSVGLGCGIQMRTACRVVANAKRYLGVPYVRNRASPSKGFDDVGFVRYVFRTVGVTLPPDRQQMYASDPIIHPRRLRPGNLLFFNNVTTAGLSHVGIYVGHGRFIHAEWYQIGVTITRLVNDPRDGNFWSQHLYAATDPLRRH